MKGKEAARAARQRAEDLGAALATCQERAVADRVLAKEREQSLKAELGRLGGRLEREVADLSAARIREAEDRLTAEWQSERENTRAKLLEATDYLSHTEGFLVTPTALTEFCRILNISFGEFVGDASDTVTNRYSRRTTSRRMNANHEAWRSYHGS